MTTILHVIDTTGPGGAETIFLQLASKVVMAGHSSIALVRAKGWVHSELCTLGIPVHILDCKGSFNIGYLYRLVSLVKSENVDVIQSHLLGSNVYCSLAGFLTGIRVITTFHGLVDISEREKFRGVKLLALRLGSSRIVTVTKKLEEAIKKLPVLSEDKIETIYNGIQIDDYDRTEFRTFRKLLKIRDNEVLIGSLGNIRKPKNYPLAIETINELHKQGKRVHYAIAGQGSEKQVAALMELVVEYDLESYVHILGFTRNVQDFLSDLDFFFMSSSSEGHPLALTQAMANGVPILATECGIEEIIEDQKEAIISRQHTAKALAGFMQNMISCESRGSLLATRARVRAEKFYSLDAMFDSYFYLYGIGR